MIDPLVLSDDLGPVVARYLDQRSPVEQSRANGPHLPAAWPGMATEVGLAGLLVPESHGGQGAGFLELGAAVLEAGRHGWSGPLVPTAGVAAHLLRTLDPDDAAGLQRAIAEQGRVVVVACHEDAAGESLASEAAYADGAVTATRCGVDGGTHAAEVLLLAQHSGEPVLVAAVLDDGNVTAQDAVDPGRGLARIQLSGAPAREVARGDGVAPAVADAWTVGALLTAADSVGAAERALNLALEYAATREQFGRAIGSFQAVKHNLVGMYAELELARSAVREALHLLEGDTPDWREATSAAAAVAGDATTHVLREAIQVHGGIGFTWEHELSHHFRRVMACRGLYGTPSTHRRVVATARGLG
ncbi:acyl-CoA dehydrogenase family protein [Nocardioides panacisoli]|uniref:acyl-CoA dehydrogenase family protein n=1 Tax=Nocardioides panacisoli TaxID=627624 RepID=UPI001C634C23|nr:acyl-CoA dehydrogenase family protein [Nocardioides panacisoli]QYJ03612.1 acyl-CoA dehydrogenase family protein [Nocardioides panacisoli]